MCISQSLQSTFLSERNVVRCSPIALRCVSILQRCLFCVLYVLQKASFSFTGCVSQALRDPTFECGHLLLTPLAPHTCLSGSANDYSFTLVISAMNPNACRATGRGLQPKGVRVKEVADFKVFTKGAGTGELSVSVKGPSESDSSLSSAALPTPLTFLELSPLFGIFV